MFESACENPVRLFSLTEHERDGNGSSYLFLAGRVGVRPS